MMNLSQLTPTGQRAALSHREPLLARGRPLPRNVACRAGGDNERSEKTEFPSFDPEAKLRRYGKFFGKVFKIDDWLESVPRVRVRTTDKRQQDVLVDLAVLNERLAGHVAPWEARRRLEYLKQQRRTWEHVYNYVTKQDAATTLELIEEAHAKMEQLTSDEARETNSVSDLKHQLQQLQEEVDEASERLKLTQEKVQQNLARVAELKAEAAALEALRQQREPAAVGSVAAATTAAPSSRLTSSSVSTVPTRSAAAAATAAVASSITTTSSSRSSSSMVADPVASPSSSSSSNSRTLGRRDSSGSNSRKIGLRSSLEAEEALKNFWYPVDFTSTLKADTLVPFELFNEPWVLFRDENGKPSCVKDECAHRACPLSLGKVVEGKVECAYHGWQFAADGACTKMPSTRHCPNVAVSALPCVEKDGFVWVWPGQGEPPQVPSVTLPPPGYDIHAEIMIDVPVEHGLLMENLLDLAHAPFTHTSTFAKGWPVPDFVKFHANKMLSGNWDPYPIDMAFQPPCMVISRIGLAQPGKIMRGVTANMCENHLHQLHVCMPSKKGHTRLLYRMSLDFIPWVRYIPGIDRVWKSVAGQVLGEDLCLVAGQQDRLERGGNTWANPVSYDKLAVRYRRWRNSVAAAAAGAAVAGSNNSGSSKWEDSGRQEDFTAAISMSAGTMFAPDEDADMYVDQQQL